MGDKKASLPWIPTGPCSALFYYYFLLLFLFVCFFLSFRSCFPCGSASKESMCNVGDLDSIPGFRRSSGEGKGYLLQYSCLENSRAREALAGYSPWGHKESDMTKGLILPLSFTFTSHFTNRSSLKYTEQRQHYLVFCFLVR